ncbi:MULTISPECIES: energy transducer TonB [unclassified Flavobacterium]|uniref:energy transducer TonB n=1 Tax=unclassified Flavobacterium TaxID=196869 RepID=UPI003622648E
MKNVLLVAFFVATNLLWAQNNTDKTIYLDSIEKNTTEGNHFYTRIIKEYSSEKDNYKVFEYYKSGQLRKEYTLKDKTNLNSKTGILTTYSENGIKKQEQQISDSETGIDYTTNWYEGGQLYQEIESNKKTKITTETNYYTNGNKLSIEKNNFSIPNAGLNNKIIQAWDKNNNHTVKDGNGNYQIETDFFKINGAVKDSLKDGEWIEQNKATGEKIIEKFKNGKFIKGKRIELDGTVITYEEQEIAAMPARGYSDFSQFIAMFFVYSKEALKNNISGKVILEFIIETDGSINNIVVIKSLGYGLDEESIRIVKEYKSWSPGKIRGKNIRTRYHLPLRLTAQ